MRRTSQIEVLPSLGCLNYATTASNIYAKLPKPIRSKWSKILVTYAQKHGDTFPPFAVFTKFITEFSQLENHPNIAFNVEPKAATMSKSKHDVKTFKTDMQGPKVGNEQKFCSYHNLNGHTLLKCKVFPILPLEDKNKVIRENRLCLKCLQATNDNHRASSSIK